MDFKLKKPLARNAPADPDDVRLLKRALNRLNYYQPPKDIGMNDIPDTEMFEGLEALQRDHELPVNGIVKPGDGTESTVQNAVRETDGRYYIWVTMGDNKVRPKHAALSGEKRRFGEGLEPGQDPRCRCSADPVPSLSEREKNKLCQQIWDNLTNIRKKLIEIRSARNGLERRVHFNKNKIDQLWQTLRDILGVSLPDISHIKAGDLLKSLGKIVARIEIIVKIDQIYDIAQHIIQLKDENEKLAKEKDALEQYIQALRKREKELQEEFNLRCPNFFD